MARSEATAVPLASYTASPRTAWITSVSRCSWREESLLDAASAEAR